MYNEYSKLSPDAPIHITIGVNTYLIPLGDIVKLYVLMAISNGSYGDRLYDVFTEHFGFKEVGNRAVSEFGMDDIDYYQYEEDILKKYLHVYYDHKENKSKDYDVIENMQEQLFALKKRYKDKYGVDFDV